MFLFFQWYILIYINKTKYFRLRLSDEVGTERPETDLRLTRDWPETDLWEKDVIQCFRALCAPQTDRQTEWLLELLDGAKKRLDSIMIMNSLLFFTAFEWVIKPRPAVTFLVCYNNLQTLCFLHEHIIVLNYRFIALNFSTFTNILKVATIYFAYVNFWRMAFYSYELARIWLLNIHTHSHTN